MEEKEGKGEREQTGEDRKDTPGSSGFPKVSRED